MLIEDPYNHETDFSFIDDPEEYQEGDDIDADTLWLKLSCVSQDPRVDDAVQYLVRQHKFTGNKKSVKKCLRCLVINTIRLWKSEKSSLIYHRGNEHYSKMRKDRRENPLRITRTLIPVIDTLIEEGYLEGETGYFANYWEAKCSSIIPLEKMEHLITTYDLTSVKVEEAINTPLIVVRIKGKKKRGKKDKDILYYPRGNDVSEMERKLSTINALLAITDIRLAQGTMLPPNVCPDDIALHRVFNDRNLEKGGRFYGGFWQQLPSELRSKILINGEATVELDFSGQHIGLLYAVLGHEIPDSRREDPYGCYDDSRFPRKLIKMAVLTAINSTDLKQAWRGTLYNLKSKKDDTKEEWRQTTEFRKLIRTQKDFEEPIQEFLAIHPLLREGMYKGWGSKLQCLDATVAEHILYVLAQKWIAVLPVHDSFIVQERYKEELLAVMKEAYLQSPDPVIRKAYTKIKRDVDGQKVSYAFTVTPAPIFKHRLKCPIALGNSSATRMSDAFKNAVRYALPEPQSSSNSH